VAVPGYGLSLCSFFLETEVSDMEEEATKSSGDLTQRKSPVSLTA
jgi:hypothetical protein